MDSNNYLDIRNENHYQDQGTVRVDHVFPNNDTIFGRYSVGAEHGFSPSSGMTTTTENLPGFGANFDNLVAAGSGLVEPCVFRNKAEHGLARVFAPVHGPNVTKQWRQ